MLDFRDPMRAFIQLLIHMYFQSNVFRKINGVPRAYFFLESSKMLNEFLRRITIEKVKFSASMTFSMYRGVHFNDF
jgi:hypothetical protein